MIWREKGENVPNEETDADGEGKEKMEIGESSTKAIESCAPSPQSLFSCDII